MAEKKMTNEDMAELRTNVLKALLALMDETPPLGEYYEGLLRELIDEAYKEAKGKLTAAKKKAFLEEIF